METILGALENPDMNDKDTSLRHAVESLLAEAGKNPDAATGGMLYEGFGGGAEVGEKKPGN